ncbi:NAD(P)/FAD-dependent oxidoreductase [Trichlorobacter ammonificans]|uniref:NADH:ubiquinone reductase (non-electrogenic) n=1 Tax=Trichlorobacter ammonificans TaxID=2916410 RepID=A0ABM9D781_9BACT|nr:NAD(P)/FAD-dependent oxidoreductase [Trichlorobacter ammonificans]CAH2030334.1 Type II NADH:quinone oxidoreductase Ndh [Trichlorobacter ammonificans]
MSERETRKTKRVVIVGMGFGGIRAAQCLADCGLEVVLVDRNNYHLFQPLLYQVATAGLEQESIAYPVRALIRGWKNLSFRMTEVTGLSLEDRYVQTEAGGIAYDYLILAGGSETNYFGNKGVEQHAFDLKRLPDAESLRNTILGIFEQAVQVRDPELRRQLLTFVVVGGGPTGVEFAGALSELIRYVFRKDYPTLDLDESRVILLEAAPAILLAMPEKLREYAKKNLERMGVEVRCNTMVADAGPGTVTLAGGEVIVARTLFWSAGVKAAPLAGMVPGDKGPGGRIPVNPDLSLPGYDGVFVVGDMALVMQDGKPLPMVAPVAMQQGRYAARAILQREQGGQPEPFRYRDKGSMATIGRSSAVATGFGVSLSGYFAWLAWLFLHLYYLIGFRNRIVVLLNWAWYYWFHERQVRLITTPECTEPVLPKENNHG